jgi:hypothetical protein
MVAEKEREIVGLMAARATLEDRIRVMEAMRDGRADEFAAFLLDHVMFEGDVQLLLPGAQGHLPEVAEALERVQAARQQVAEPEEDDEPILPVIESWDQFAILYRAADTPLPENHPKLIAGMVAWADDNGWNIERMEGVPEDTKQIWALTAKNCRIKTTDGEFQRERTVEILRKFGDGRRHSVAAMAKSCGYKTKAIAEVLDMMLAADFKNTISREQSGKDVMWTIRRPAKVPAK